jgi:hypothetical protein
VYSNEQGKYVILAKNRREHGSDIGASYKKIHSYDASTRNGVTIDEVHCIK